MGEYTLLHFACSIGDWDIFNFIHSKCINLHALFSEVVREENSTLETPLHFAVSRNNIEIA